MRKKWVFVGNVKVSSLNWIERFLQQINQSMSAMLPIVHLPNDLRGLFPDLLPERSSLRFCFLGKFFASIFWSFSWRGVDPLSKLPIVVWEGLVEYRKHKLAKTCYLAISRRTFFPSSRKSGPSSRILCNLYTLAKAILRSLYCFRL